MGRSAEAYQADLLDVIGRFRWDLGAPHLPFVVGELGRFLVAQKPKAAAINDALRTLPKHAAHVRVVTSAGLGHRDGTHFTTSGARILGARYAAAMLAMQGW